MAHGDSIGLVLMFIFGGATGGIGYLIGIRYPDSALARSMIKR